MLSSPFSSKENYWFFYFLRLPAIDLEFSFFEWSKDRLRFAYDVLTFTFLYINGFINLKEPIETEYGDRSMEWLNEILVRFNKKAILNFFRVLLCDWAVPISRGATLVIVPFPSSWANWFKKVFLYLSYLVTWLIQWFSKFWYCFLIARWIKKKASGLPNELLPSSNSDESGGIDFPRHYRNCSHLWDENSEISRASLLPGWSLKS